MLPSELLAPSLFTPPSKLRAAGEQPCPEAAPTSPPKPRRMDWAAATPGVVLAAELWSLILQFLFASCKSAPLLACVDKIFKALVAEILDGFRGGGHPWWSGAHPPLLPADVQWLP